MGQVGILALFDCETLSKYLTSLSSLSSSVKWNNGFLSAHHLWIMEHVSFTHGRVNTKLLLSLIPVATRH